MADMYEVVELCARTDDRLIERATVDGGVGADLDIVADYELPNLWELHIAAMLLVAHIAKAIGAEYRPGVNDHAASQCRARVDHDARIDLTVIADHNAGTDLASRGDVGPIANNDIWLDHGVGIDARRG